MALTREFKETVVARARRDAKFRDAMFAEAINAYLAGDTQTGKAMLRDLVNATIGFEGLSAEIRKPSKPSSSFRISVSRRLLPEAFTPFHELYDGMTVTTPASSAPM